MDNFHKLIEGFHNFKQTYFLKERQYFESLEKAQNPKTLVVACCDSRVDPAILLHCKPGDLFVIRNVAALVPAVTQASNPCSVMSAIEYGVNLNVEHIVVMGHSHCGGIHGLMAPETIAGETYIQDWVGIASPALERLQAITGDEDEKTRSRHCEEGAVLISLDNLLSYPWIAERVKKRTAQASRTLLRFIGRQPLSFQPRLRRFRAALPHYRKSLTDFGKILYLARN